MQITNFNSKSSKKIENRTYENFVWKTEFLFVNAGCNGGRMCVRRQIRQRACYH